MILVTGATGNVGGAVAELLRERNIEFLSAGHSMRNDRILDFSQPETFQGALEGVTRIFLMRPPHIANIDETFRPLLEAMKRSSVERIVFLSVIGAEKNSFLPHRKIERLIETSGIPYSFLRPSFFMQYLAQVHATEIRQQGEIIVPAGQGKTNFIDCRDIAEIAVHELQRRDQSCQAYDLTGKDIFGYDEIATMLSEITGQKVSYQSPSIFRFISHWWGREKIGKILVMTALYTLARWGKAAQTNSTMHQILGHEPRSLRDYLRENRDLFRSSN